MVKPAIRLEVARDQNVPNGSRDHSYDITAPIDDQGQPIHDERKTNPESRVGFLRF